MRKIYIVIIFIDVQFATKIKYVIDISQIFYWNCQIYNNFKTDRYISLSVFIILFNGVDIMFVWSVAKTKKGQNSFPIAFNREMHFGNHRIVHPLTTRKHPNHICCNGNRSIYKDEYQINQNMFFSSLKAVYDFSIEMHIEWKCKVIINVVDLECMLPKMPLSSCLLFLTA